jgi:hypothetical protein
MVKSRTSTATDVLASANRFHTLVSRRTIEALDRRSTFRSGSRKVSRTESDLGFGAVTSNGVSLCGLTNEMSGGRKTAKPAVGHPLEGSVGRHPHSLVNQYSGRRLSSATAWMRIP